MLRREQKLIERAELSANLAHKDDHPDYAITGGYYNQASMAPMYTFESISTFRFGSRENNGPH